MSGHLALIAAGDTVYVFAEGDERIDCHVMVLYASNLDVERLRVPAAQFTAAVAARLVNDGVIIVDARTPEMETR